MNEENLPERLKGKKYWLIQLSNDLGKLPVKIIACSNEINDLVSIFNRYDCLFFDANSYRRMKNSFVDCILWNYFDIEGNQYVRIKRNVIQKLKDNDMPECCVMNENYEDEIRLRTTKCGDIYEFLRNN